PQPFGGRLSSALTAPTGTVRRLAFFQPLPEAHGCPGEIECGAQLIFQEALIAEVQRAWLIGEKDERWRCSTRLCEVIDFHLAACRRSAASQIHTLEPAI